MFQLCLTKKFTINKNEKKKENWIYVYGAEA